MRRSRATRRGIATIAIRLVALLSYCLLTFGMPMPVRKGELHDDPFPCQENACGCQTARQCWTSCRCLSPAERVRWAVKRGVPIPDYAVLPPAEELVRILAESADVDACIEPGRCCCCSKKKEEAPSEQSSGVIRFAVGSMIAKCCGLSLDSVVPFDVSLPPIKVIPPSMEAIATTPTLIEDGVAPRNDPPPSPPPRFQSI